MMAITLKGEPLFDTAKELAKIKKTEAERLERLYDDFRRMSAQQEKLRAAKKGEAIEIDTSEPSEAGVRLTYPEYKPFVFTPPKPPEQMYDSETVGKLTAEAIEFGVGKGRRDSKENLDRMYEALKGVVELIEALEILPEDSKKTWKGFYSNEYETAKQVLKEPYK